MSTQYSVPSGSATRPSMKLSTGGWPALLTADHSEAAFFRRSASGIAV